MIYKRVAARLRGQDWAAISIELSIVIVGVFIGTWVANWNADRAANLEIQHLILAMRPELARVQRADEADADYFAVTRNYARVALAGWADDPKVTDHDFVIAAYQASQIIGGTQDNQTYSMMLGADQFRKIDDPVLRNALMRLMSFNYEPLSFIALQTPYRDHVRELIPNSIQEVIRAQCGDNISPDEMFSLPESCNAGLPNSDVSRGAAMLRAHPELVQELQLHLSRVATFVFNLRDLDRRVRICANLINKRKQ